MNVHGKDLKIFAGNGSKKLAQEIAKIAGVSLGDAEVGEFSDGEVAVTIREVVRGSDVFIVQSTSTPVNNNLMELLVMIDASKRASAGRITAVMPYFGYARQDRKAKARDPISAKLVANLLTVAGADRILTMDLHAPQLQGFFDIPVDHLQGGPLIARYYKEKLGDAIDDVVVVSPDMGSVARARKFAQIIEVPIAIIDKRRPKANVCEVLNVVGDVRGKHAIIIDDLIDTAGTICNGAESLMDLGAIDVTACCTHAVLSGPALERIQNSAIKELVILNTIELPEYKKVDMIKILSSADIFAQAIKRIYGDMSISTLFTQSV